MEEKSYYDICHELKKIGKINFEYIEGPLDAKLIHFLEIDGKSVKHDVWKDFLCSRVFETYYDTIIKLYEKYLNNNITVNIKD